ncbi:MAG: hypothetical protein HY617_03295 [Candidatus Sungbacteria bacterium]|nr:hypothetical protein [Candidatus Sungbacteria bacterium]
MTDRIPSKAEIFNVVEAQSETLDELSKRLVKIEQLSDKQESRNFNIIIAVIIAAVLIVVTVAVQVLLSDKSDRERNDNLLEQIHTTKEEQLKLDIKQSNLKDTMDSLRTKNPYLK